MTGWNSLSAYDPTETGYTCGRCGGPATREQAEAGECRTCHSIRLLCDRLLVVERGIKELKAALEVQR